MKGTVSVTGSTFQRAGSGLQFVTDTSGTLDMTVQSSSFLDLNKEPGGTARVGNYGISVVQEGSLASIVRVGSPLAGSKAISLVPVAAQTWRPSWVTPAILSVPANA